jgi:hypothetical protein
MTPYRCRRRGAGSEMFNATRICDDSALISFEGTVFQCVVESLSLEKGGQ